MMHVSDAICVRIIGIVDFVITLAYSYYVYSIIFYLQKFNARENRG